MATDDSDAADAAALRDRVAALEQTVSEQQATIESLSTPTASRRGFVKAAAAVAGLGALGIYSSYPASAQAAGQIGTQSEPVDVEAWSLNVQDQLAGDLDAGGNSLTNVAAVETGSVDTEQIGSERHFTESYDGVDADARLDAALSAAAAGDIIHLESASYPADRQISTSVICYGTSSKFDAGTDIDGTWTIATRGVYHGLGGNDGEIVVQAADTAIHDGMFRGSFPITVQAGRCLITRCNAIDVSFESATSGGLVDSCTATSVVDNGSNTIGDIV